MISDKLNRISVSSYAAAIVIGLLVTIFYSGALKNDTALDDVMVLTENQYVQSGIKGIPDIFSHDSFYGATQRSATRLSWRYRPLSLACFSIIHEVVGNNWSIFHFFNLLVYFLCGWFGFRFLRNWFFPDRSFLALIISAAFIILPVHVEVVANIKSADELLACLFSILFLDHLLKWDVQRKKSYLTAAILFFTAALFSKESSVLLVVLAPAIIYVKSSKTRIQVVKQSIPFIILTLLFLVLRLSISEVPDNKIDITSDPYFLASFYQKIATVSVVLLKYIRMVFFPDFLSFDYGYQHIPYSNFSDPLVWFSIVLHLTMMTACVWNVIRRKPIGFFLLAYLGGIILISNLFLDVGPIMADRFLFLPSFFLIVAFVFFIQQISIKKQGLDVVVLFVLLLMAIPAAFSMTKDRVPEWKDNLTLYKADLPKVPGSFRVLAFNAMEEINLAQSFTDSVERNEKYRYGIRLMEKAYRIYPDYKNMYFKWGIAYYGLGKIDSAYWAWGRLRELWPTNQYNASNVQLINEARYNEHMAVYNANYMKKDYPFLSVSLNNALKYKPDMAPVWTLLGKVYFLQGKTDSARWAFAKALELNPGSEEDKRMLNMLK